MTNIINEHAEDAEETLRFDVLNRGYGLEDETIADFTAYLIGRLHHLSDAAGADFAAILKRADDAYREHLAEGGGGNYTLPNDWRVETAEVASESSAPGQ